MKIYRYLAANRSLRKNICLHDNFTIKIWKRWPNSTCKIRPPKGIRNDQLAYYNVYWMAYANMLFPFVFPTPICFYFNKPTNPRTKWTMIFDFIRSPLAKKTANIVLPLKKQAPKMSQPVAREFFQLLFYDWIFDLRVFWGEGGGAY